MTNTHAERARSRTLTPATTSAGPASPHRRQKKWSLLGRLARRVVFFYAPKILGGRDARKAVAGAGARRLDESLTLHQVEWRRVGPDLNVPQSIVEYRPAEQVKAYILNPTTFRYSNMPAHDYLKPADLDALVAYFTAMKDRKHDPGAQP